MTHHIDINGVQSIEIEPVAPNLLAAHGSKRHGRRILIRTQFGMTTINLHAESAAELAVSEGRPLATPPRTRNGASPGPRGKR
jgi:hypothetical protein